jgi:hypothetical protein
MTIEPSSADRAPAPGRRRFTCPRCGAFADQWWTDVGYTDEVNNEFCQLERRQLPVTPPEDMAEMTAVLQRAGESLWKAAHCASCERWSMWYRHQMVFPTRRVGSPAHADMPAEVLELYEEAAEVAAVSRRAGAAFARVMVERLIKILDPGASPTAKLHQRIARLKSRVSTPLGQMLDVVRVTGNGAVHVDDQPDDLVIMALDDQEGPALLELLLETANDLVDELITRPKIVGDLWDKLPEAVKAQIHE